MEHNDFDDIIREKLNQFSPEGSPLWEQMQERLSAEKAFDGRFREKLGGQQHVPSEALWNRLSDNLELSRVQGFDTAIRQKVKSLHPPFVSQHWYDLAEQLRWAVQMRRFFFKAKSLELLAFVLLFSVFSFFSPPVSKTVTSSDPALPPFPPQTAQRQSTEEPSDIASLHPTARTPQDTAFRTSKAIPAATATGYSLSKLPILPQQVSPRTSTLEIPAAKPKTTHLQFENFSSLPTCSGRLFTTAALKKPRLRYPSKRSRLAVDLYSMWDWHRIHTPADADLGTQAHTQYAPGYSGGVAASLHHRRWIYRLGAQWSRQTYTPVNIVEIYDGSLQEGGYRTDQLDNVSLQVLRIPGQVAWRINPQSRWSAYLTAGAALNIVTFSHYHRTQLPALPEVDLPETLSPIQPSRGKPKPTPGEQPNSSKLNQKDFDPGLLEGGNFQESSYLSLLGGLGLEYRVQPQLSLFSESTYQYALPSGGFGPTNDRIHTFTLGLGVRWYWR